jgi:hypothetical protein
MLTEKSSKQQPPAALAQTPKVKIKQETATPKEAITLSNIEQLGKLESGISSLPIIFYKK